MSQLRDEYLKKDFLRLPSFMFLSTSSRIKTDANYVGKRDDVGLLNFL